MKKTSSKRVGSKTSAARKTGTGTTKKSASRQKQTGSSAKKAIQPTKVKFQRILVPVDFSESSRRAICDAMGLAQQYGSKVTLLHVVEPVMYPADLGYAPVDVRAMGINFKDAAMSRLKRLCDEELPAGINVAPRVRVGPAYKEITDAAREEKADLLVISTHGYTGLTHVLLGSTAERVIRHAPCPVLTIRRT